MRKEEAMAGAGGRQALLSPSTPRNTSVGWQSLSLISPPPQHQTKEKPLPPGLLPPQPGLYIQWFSAVLWLRARLGEVARQSQLDSGSDLGLSVHPGTHSLCHLFF